MNKTVTDVLALLGIGVTVGAIFWIGFFKGVDVKSNQMHKDCQTVTIVKFKDDPQTYGCLPIIVPPNEPGIKYDYI